VLEKNKLTGKSTALQEGGQALHVWAETMVEILLEYCRHFVVRPVPNEYEDFFLSTTKMGHRGKKSALSHRLLLSVTAPKCRARRDACGHPFGKESDEEKKIS